MRSRSSVAVRAAHARFQVPAGDHVGSAAAELVGAPRPAPQGGEQKGLEPPPPPAHSATQEPRPSGQLARSRAATPGGGFPQAGDHGTHRVAGPPLPRKAAGSKLEINELGARSQNP
jgi:hypothetical protein